MCLWSLRLGAFVTCLFLGLLQVFAAEIDDSLVCKICNGYQICGRKHSQTPECLNGIPCTVKQYRLCGMMVDTITNQKCDRPGIFPDPKCPRKYYTCNWKKNNSCFEKRTRVCPAGKTFDSVTKHCLSTDEKLMLQTIQNHHGLKTTADDMRFVCRKVGIFPDPHDCKMYHSCNTKLESQDFYCPDGTYFDGINCKKTHKCLSQLEKNSQNQIKRGEEIYTQVRKLLATSTIPEFENGLQDTTGTNNTHYADDGSPIPESVNQTIRSMWNLQKSIRDKIHELQNMSEMSFTDLQNLQDILTTEAKKMTTKVKILTDYKNEKICSEVKKLNDEGSLKLKLSLCNTDVKCYCLHNDNGTNEDRRTPDPTVWVRSPNGNFTGEVYNETDIGQTVLFKETTVSEFYSQHPTVDDEAQEGKTSNYRTAKISTTGNYTDTTPRVDVFTNNDDESHVTQELETTFPTKRRAATTEINTTIQVYVTTARSDIEYSSDIQSTYYEGTNFTTENDTNTAGYSTETTHQIYTNDKIQDQTVSSGESMTTLESETEYQTVNEESHNGNTIAEHPITTVEPYTKRTFLSDADTDKDEHAEGDTYEEKSSTHEPKTTESPIETTLHIDVRTNEENDGHETLKKQTLLYQKRATEHSTLNEETSDAKTTTSLEENLTTTGLDNETTLHEDTHTNTEHQELSEKETTHEHKSTTEFYSEQSNVQGDTEPNDTETNYLPFEPSTTEFHTETTLNEQTLLYQTEHSTLYEETSDAKTTTSLEENLTTTGLDNETTLPEDTHTNTEDQEEETVPDFEHKSKTTEFYSEQSSDVEDDIEPKTNYSPFESSTTGFHTETTLNEQTLLYQTEHSTLNEETSDGRMTTYHAEILTTTGLDNETTLYEDTHTNNDVQEEETVPDFEHKSTTTEFYNEQSSDVQDIEPKTSYSPFESSTTEFHTETTLNIHGDEENEKGTTAPFTTTATDFNNELTSYTDVHSNDEDKYTDVYETTATPKDQATHPLTKGTDSEPTTEANREYGEEAFTRVQKSATGGSHSETTIQAHEEYDTEDQNYENDEYDIDSEDDIDVQYDYSATYDVKATSPFNRKYTASEFSTESIPHSKNYTDSEERYTTRESETSTKYISTAYGESTLHIDITSEKNNNKLEEITTEISKSEHSPHGLDIQVTEATSVHEPGASNSYSKNTNGGTTSLKDGTALLTSIQTPKPYIKFIISTPKTKKNKSQTFNPERSPPKGTTSNRSCNSTTNDSTSKFTVSPKDSIRRAVTTKTTLSTILMHAGTTAKPPGPFRCSSAGYFVDPEDCHSYYRCTAVLVNRKPCSKCDNEGRWKLVESHHTCKNDRWFSSTLRKCVGFKPLIC